MKSGIVKRSTSFSGTSGSSGIDGIFSSLALKERKEEKKKRITFHNPYSRTGIETHKSCGVSHLRGDGRPWFLNVKFGGALCVAVTVVGRDGVKSFILIGHMRNEKRVSAALLENTDVLTFYKWMV